MYLVEDRGQYWHSLAQTIGCTAEEPRFLDEHADEEIRRRLLAVPERGEVRRGCTARLGDQQRCRMKTSTARRFWAGSAARSRDRGH
jgi:hypothetical protein